MAFSLDGAVSGASTGSYFGPIGTAIGGIAGGLFGGSKGPSLKSLNKQAEVQYIWQRRLNQTALQDRVADATAAGIHPLYAIGGNVNAGGISMPTGDQSDGNRFADMGQNIERAVTAHATKEERALMRKSSLLDLERKELENEVLRNQAAGSKIALLNQAGQPPANQRVSLNPSDQEMSRSDDPATIAAQNPATQEITTRDGSKMVAPSSAAKNATEDDLLLQMEWYYRNKIIPTMRELRMFDPWNYTREYFNQRKKGG